MEFVSELSKEEYESFVSHAKKTHFMQSYAFGEIRKSKGFTPHYVGLKENGELVCSALLLEKKLLFGYSYDYVPRGYVIDYENFSLLKEFTNQLKAYAKKKHVIFIKIDPDIKRHSLNLNGEVVEGDNHEELITFLKKLGYRHHGFNTGFEGEQPRFTFRLNIDDSIDEIRAGFHPTTRKILNKKNQYHLDIYRGKSSDIEDFYEVMKETAKREGLLQAPISYYQTFYEIFHEVGCSDLYIAKVNLSSLREVFEKNIQDLNQQLLSLDDEKYKNTTKNANKKQEIKNQLERVQRDYQLVLDIPEENIVLSSIMTVKYKDMVWTVHGGNHTKLLNLNANYLLYYTIIEDAKKEGYKVVDFFGTCGEANPKPENPIYGIHSFKKRLGGEYTEFIGEFDLVCHSLMYFLFYKLVPIYRKIVRSIKMRG